MTLRDMTPDELNVFEEEEELVQDSDEDTRNREESPEAREVDRDGDGLPDGPVKRRVPS